MAYPVKSRLSDITLFDLLSRNKKITEEIKSNITAKPGEKHTCPVKCCISRLRRQDVSSAS